MSVFRPRSVPVFLQTIIRTTPKINVKEVLGKNNKYFGALSVCSFPCSYIQYCSGEELISFGIPTALSACRYHYSTSFIWTHYYHTAVSYLLWPQSRLGFLHLSFCTALFLSFSIFLVKKDSRTLRWLIESNETIFLSLERLQLLWRPFIVTHDGGKGHVFLSTLEVLQIGFSLFLSFKPSVNPL